MSPKEIKGLTLKDWVVAGDKLEDEHIVIKKSNSATATHEPKFLLPVKNLVRDVFNDFQVRASFNIVIIRIDLPPH